MTSIFKKTLLTSAALLSSSFLVANAHADINSLVSTLTQGQLKVVKTYPATGNLMGVIAKPTRGGGSILLFADKDGNYMVAGNVITAKGENLTQSFTAKYIDAQVAYDAFAQIDKVSVIKDGKDDAKHKAYVVVDPNCIYCHVFSKEVAPLIADGTLQIQWIPAGFLKPDSIQKAAKMLSGKDNAERLSYWKLDQNKFDDKTEEGSLANLQEDAKNPETVKAFDAARANTKFFSETGMGVTPSIIFVNNDGNPIFAKGAYRGDELKALVNSMSDKLTYTPKDKNS